MWFDVLDAKRRCIGGRKTWLGHLVWPETPKLTGEKQISLHCGQRECIEGRELLIWNGGSHPVKFP
jgi:hypothetical protein